MFSSRFNWGLERNRLTTALELKRQVGVPILDLTQSNPTRVGLRYPPGILEAFADERILRYDPLPAGTLEARRAVAAYYHSRGVAVEPERILLTASTSEAYAYLFKLLADPGDEVLVPSPSYPLFEFLAVMESVFVRSYPLVYHASWTIDWESLANAVGPRTRAIVVVNPNNPTGSYLKRQDLERLTSICAGKQIALVSDEVFSDYAFGANPARVPTLADVEDGLAFSLSGLSKIAGLPQMKLGWIVVAGSSENRRLAWDRLEWIADTYLSVGTPVQSAAPRLLAEGELIQEQIRRRTSENLDFLTGSFGGLSAATVLTVEGGWCATIRIPRIRSEEEWTLELLDGWNVLVQPGFFYDFDSEAFLILSLLPEYATFQEGVSRLRECIELCGS